METTGLRTPLLDFFRKGDVSRDIRMLAAEGAVAPRLHEQVGLLMLLVGDPDEDVSRTAEATLESIPRNKLAALLARPEASVEMRAFFERRGVEPSDGGDVEDGTADRVELEAEPETTAEEKAGEEDTSRISSVAKIAGLSVVERLTLAMKGTREERSILIRDPNKIVAVAVLSSPKLTDSEVETIARMASVSEEILRIIGHTRAWMKNYNVVAGLVRNPKTPVALSMNLLARLNEKDLRMLSTDRTGPDVLRITARKKLALDKH
jgi:hypothetical protein